MMRRSKMTFRRVNAVLLSLLIVAAAGSAFGDEDKDKKKKEGNHDDDRMEHKLKADNEDHERDDEHERVVPANRIVIINQDVNRLETILNTTQGTTVIVPQATLMRIGNESFVLANRIAS